MSNEQLNNEVSRTPVKRCLGIIKVCPNPGCEAVYHNVPKNHTRCNDCGGNIMHINENTFWKKFSSRWFQYDFLTGDYYRPQKQVQQLSLDLE